MGKLKTFYSKTTKQAIKIFEFHRLFLSEYEYLFDCFG